jgi:hypothetical protein
MKNRLASKAFAAWTYVQRRLWTGQVLSCRCISILKDREISLSDAFLGSAEEFRLELFIRGPWLRWRISQGLGIRITRDQSARISHPDEIGDLRVRHLGRGLIKVCARVPANSLLDREWLHFEIYFGTARLALSRVELRVLGNEAAQHRLIESLRACCLRLWLCNRTGFRPARAVAASSGSLVPEFTLPASEFAAFVPPFKALLTLELLSPAGRFELNRQPIELGREAVRFRGREVPLDETRLFGQPGNYRLVARIGGRQIAQLPFQFLSQADLLLQILIPRIEIHAQTRNGECVPGVTTLHWEDHKSFQACIEVTSPAIAPDTLVPCTAYIRDGPNVLQREDIVFPLDRFSRKITLEPVHFGMPGLQTQPKPARLSVSVTINGTEKACALVLVLPPERITNFEGQLTFEVDDLPFDEAEYSQIVHRLGLQTQADPRRGFWQWLQTKLS